MCSYGGQPNPTNQAPSEARFSASNCTLLIGSHTVYSESCIRNHCAAPDMAIVSALSRSSPSWSLFDLHSQAAKLTLSMVGELSRKP